MNEIAIANITYKDFEGKRIRILVHQKEMFPEERPGFPETYDIAVVWKGRDYRCTYTIGSKDGKSRSGALRLKDGLAVALGNRVGKRLALKRTDKSKYHLNLASL